MLYDRRVDSVKLESVCGIKMRYTLPEEGLRKCLLHLYRLEECTCTAKLILYIEGVEMRQGIIAFCTWQ